MMALLLLLVIAAIPFARWAESQSPLVNVPPLGTEAEVKVLQYEVKELKKTAKTWNQMVDGTYSPMVALPDARRTR